MFKMCTVALLGTFLVGAGFPEAAQESPSPTPATKQIWIQKSFILTGEPDLDYFGDDELGTISELIQSQWFCGRVAKSDQVARLPGIGGPGSARRIAEGLSVKRSSDPKRSIVTLCFQGGDRASGEVVLRTVAQALEPFLNDERRTAWEALLQNQEKIRQRAEARLKKAEAEWVEFYRKAPPELANGNLEARQTAVALRERELAIREHEFNLNIDALTNMVQKRGDSAALQMAVADWVNRHGLPGKDKEKVTPEAVIEALRLERDAVQRARAVNKEELARLQDAVLAAAKTLAQADHLKSQLEQARWLANEAATKVAALETRREALPTYRVVALSRAED